MPNDVLPFFVYKEDVAAMADLRFLGCGCVNINWGLELLEHTRYAAYNSVGIPHPLGALATTPKASKCKRRGPLGQPAGPISASHAELRMTSSYPRY